ncbi:MAG: hypothetical protein ACI9ON_000451 [Limisphaerales bacterium]|jgi:hypothetical protein
MIRLFFSDDPNGVNNAWNVATQGQHNIDPKVEAKADLQKYAQWRQNDAQNDPYDIHRFPLPLLTVY